MEAFGTVGFSPLPAHGVRVYFLDAPVTRADLEARLNALMANPPANLR